jgi:hypothetical protein
LLGRENALQVNVAMPAKVLMEAVLATRETLLAILESWVVYALNRQRPAGVEKSMPI